MADEWLQTKLANGYTVARYYLMEAERDKSGIADLVLKRFMERFFTPLKARSAHGFILMAISCLMIEALEAFCQGKLSTRGKSESMFVDFFKRNRSFGLDEASARLFYSDVRCGLLHQAEATGGWKITREAGRPLLDQATKTINARLFHNRLKLCLEEYCKELHASDWNSEIWRKARKKIRAICENCES